MSFRHFSESIKETLRKGRKDLLPRRRIILECVVVQEEGTWVVQIYLTHKLLADRKGDLIFEEVPSLGPKCRRAFYGRVPVELSRIYGRRILTYRVEDYSIICR